MRATSAAFFTSTLALTNAINLDVIYDQIHAKTALELINNPNLSERLSYVKKEFTLLRERGDYGCWCYFSDDDHEKARGDPVSKMDRICKKLHQGYTCASFDGEEEISAGTRAVGDECLPWKQSYVPFIPHTSAGTKEEECASLNALLGTCAINTCIIEAQFAEDFVQFIASTENKRRGIKVKEFTHSMDFDHAAYLAETNAKNSNNGNGGNGPVDSCCGSYPNRFPYASGRKECCNGRTYSPTMQTCCDDKVQAIGSC